MIVGKAKGHIVFAICPCLLLFKYVSKAEVCDLASPKLRKGERNGSSIANFLPGQQIKLFRDQSCEIFYGANELAYIAHFVIVPAYGFYEL